MINNAKCQTILITSFGILDNNARIALKTCESANYHKGIQGDSTVRIYQGSDIIYSSVSIYCIAFYPIISFILNFIMRIWRYQRADIIYNNHTILAYTDINTEYGYYSKYELYLIALYFTIIYGIRYRLTAIYESLILSISIDIDVVILNIIRSTTHPIYLLSIYSSIHYDSYDFIGYIAIVDEAPYPYDWIQKSS
ncbi:hypothetical protein H8356DRAFT_1321962 [Neocallimastix lanati (nom. inval.)]|nr:hypothetical protein H8356DRAFT_1321962 [Neocallimastix sp. JGI-2020a]